MEAVRTSETSVDNHFTRQYIPEDNSEHHTGRRENLKSHTVLECFFFFFFGNRAQLRQRIFFYLLNRLKSASFQRGFELGKPKEVRKGEIW
jgi:hypothetical protein